MKTAILFGSTGLVGGHLLNLLVNSNEYDKIKIFSRRDIETKNPKIEKYVIDFNELEKHKDEIVGDDCFFAIGTTRRLTPDKNDYIDVELNLPVKISKIAKNNNVKSFIYVSSGGANANSRNLYLQNKGKAEKEIIDLSFEFTAIIQPSLLLGNRKENRIGEKIVKLIPTEERKKLWGMGIKIGRYHIYLPKMLKPKAVEFRVSLWKIYNKLTPIFFF